MKIPENFKKIIKEKNIKLKKYSRLCYLEYCDEEYEEGKKSIEYNVYLKPVVLLSYDGNKYVKILTEEGEIIERKSGYIYFNKTVFEYNKYLEKKYFNEIYGYSDYYRTKNDTISIKLFNKLSSDVYPNWKKSNREAKYFLYCEISEDNQNILKFTKNFNHISKLKKYIEYMIKKYKLDVYFELYKRVGRWNKENVVNINKYIKYIKK